MSLQLTCIAVLVSRLAISVPVDAIEARQSRPVAPRGGVMMVQLFSMEQGDGWPSTLEVVFEDGHVETGVVAWIEKNTNYSAWTSNPSRIRTITPDDTTLSIDPMDAITGPVLLVELPLRGRGLVRFGGGAIDPRWTDLPISLPDLNIVPVDDSIKLPIQTVDDMPDRNPFEYWRWTLVASRLGVMPPKLPFESRVEKLAAMQGEQLWRIGFHRLAKSSRGVAATCRDLLTHVATDGSHAYACWVVQSNSLHQLLSILLDGDSSPRQLATSALRWAEDQHPHIHWLEQVYGSHVTVSIANPTLEPVVAIMRWESEDDIPIAIGVPPSRTVRCEVERGPVLDTSIFGPQTSESRMQWLSISMGGSSTTLQIVPPDVVALPPGVQLQTLHPLWTLQGVRSGRPNKVESSVETSVQVRKLMGCWEMYIQCGGIASEAVIPSDATSPVDLRGVEAITIIHHPTNAMVCIPPSGEVSGVAVPADLEVYTSTLEDRWSIRVVLPKSWVEDETFSFSVVRTHGDSMQVETGPLPCVPWSINPKPILIDLSAWDTVDKFPITLPIE